MLGSHENTPNAAEHVAICVCISALRVRFGENLHHVTVVIDHQALLSHASSNHAKGKEYLWQILREDIMRACSCCLGSLTW